MTTIVMIGQQNHNHNKRQNQKRNKQKIIKLLCSCFCKTTKIIIIILIISIVLLYVLVFNTLSTSTYSSSSSSVTRAAIKTTTHYPKLDLMATITTAVASLFDETTTSTTSNTDDNSDQQQTQLIVRSLSNNNNNNNNQINDKCNNINNITTYNDLITCNIINQHYTNWGTIYGMNRPPRTIKNIKIIGERNSGTKFLRETIHNCFDKNDSKKYYMKYYNLTNNNDNNNEEDDNGDELGYHIISNLKIRRDFVRSKHWFQPLKSTTPMKTISTSDYRDTLLIVVVRNPIDWMMAMWKSPYHSPNHISHFDTTNNNEPIPLSTWQEFISKPWTMPLYYTNKNKNSNPHNRTNNKNILLQSNFDYEYLKNLTSSKLTSKERKILLNDGICRSEFKFHQIIPCRYDFDSNPFQLPTNNLRGYEPIYELKQYYNYLKQKQKKKKIRATSKNDNDYDNQPYYDHLLQLRSDKILNWIIEIPMIMWIGGLLLVKYEDLLINGTEYMLKHIAAILKYNQQDVQKMSNNNNNGAGVNKNNNRYSHEDIEQTKLPRYCIPQPPQPERIANKRIVPSDYEQWIIQNMNIQTERLLGYYP